VRNILVTHCLAALLAVMWTSLASWGCSLTVPLKDKCVMRRDECSFVTTHLNKRLTAEERTDGDLSAAEQPIERRPCRHEHRRFMLVQNKEKLGEGAAESGRLCQQREVLASRFLLTSIFLLVSVLRLVVRNALKRGVRVRLVAAGL
jgi:hypothetical protein